MNNSTSPGASGDGHQGNEGINQNSDGCSLDELPESSTPNVHGSGEKLDMQLLLDYLRNCVNKDCTINLEFYIKAYKEWNRFFELLGSIFHFVAKDVKSKIEILEKYRQSPSSNCFITVESMIAYEKEKDLLTNSQNPSGSRTLLRLHRAFEFIIEFLRKLCEIDDHESVSKYAQEAYATTLARFHPWLIRKAANIAMYALPVKKALMEQTCIQENCELAELARQVVEVAGNIYSNVQAVYEQNNLLDLP